MCNFCDDSEFPCAFCASNDDIIQPLITEFKGESRHKELLPVYQDYFLEDVGYTEDKFEELFCSDAQKMVDEQLYPIEEEVLDIPQETETWEKIFFFGVFIILTCSLTAIIYYYRG